MQYEPDGYESGRTLNPSQISFNNNRYKNEYETYFNKDNNDASDHSYPNKASSNLEKRILQYLKPNADRQLNLAGIFNIAGIAVSIN